MADAKVDIVVENLFDILLAGTAHPGQQALIDKAGKLNRWRVTVWLELQALAFVGEIQGDDRFTDGHEIMTSEIVWVDHKLRWIRTLNSFYRLGKPRCEGDDEMAPEAEGRR